MKKLAFVTYPAQPELSADDALSLPYLKDCAVEAVAWSAPGIEWSEFDAVILRSCWDYHLRFAEFSVWLEKLKKKQVKLFNQPETILRNADKSYLRELAKAGVRTIPTVWFEKNCEISLYHELQSKNWKKAVVKPSVSATAFQTWITCPESADREERILEQMLENSTVMLQPFMSEIVAKGEWSFIFFDKQYSHAALKRARTGDFRVQSQFGGYLDKAAPPASLAEQASKVLEFMPEDLLYARVDGIDIDGEFYLMELELIEPVLFLAASAEAPRKFADAILSALEK